MRPDGGPTGAGHVVALLELGADGASLQGDGRATAEPDPHGRFLLALPEWAYGRPTLLVGRAWHLQPATLTLRLTRGAPRDGIVLELTQGALLRGRLTNGGEPLAGWPIDLASARLEVTVLGAGGPLEGADVVARCDAGEARFRTGPGATVLSVPAFAEVTLRAEHATHTSLEERCSAGAVGSRSDALLVLSPTVRAALRVWLPGAHDAGVPRLVLDRLPSSGAGEERRIELGRGTAHDEFWLDALLASPGPHALRLASTGDFRSEVRELAVPDAGVAEVAFSGARGGRYRVEHSSALATWSADWRVVDPEGRAASPGVHRSVDGSGESFEWSEASTEQRALLPDTDVVSVGRYRLEVDSREHARLSHEFDVVAGRTTRVSVQLVPK